MEDYNQILPPVRLISKAILHLIACKGKGVLVTLNGFHLRFGQEVKIMMDINFKNFVKDLQNILLYLYKYLLFVVSRRKDII